MKWIVVELVTVVFLVEENHKLQTQFARREKETPQKTKAVVDEKKRPEECLGHIESLIESNESKKKL